MSSSRGLEERISFRPGLELSSEAGQAILHLGPARIDLGKRGPGVLAALAELAGGPVNETDLASVVIDVDGEGAAIGFQMLMRRLDVAGLLSTCLCDGSRQLMSATCDPYRKATLALDSEPNTPLVMSRFVSMRANGGFLRVVSPMSEVTITLHELSIASLIASFTKPRAAEDATLACLAGSGPAHVARFLARYGVLVAFPSEDRPPSAWWSPEDLQFHRRSRVGYHGDGYGGTYRFEGQFPPLSALPTAGDPAELAFEFKPVDLGEVESSDPPLTKVIESRKSIREYDEANPITADQLGELLFRTVRVRRQFNDPKEELLDRPVPSGGSINSIVTYAAVRSCQGIEPGLYRYDGLRHGLELVSGDPAGVGALISAVPLAPGPVAVAPQVVLVFTARFGRVMWKYESMAYALILKDLGVIFQSLYLVSTAMGLAPCAQGGGDSSIFAKLAGLDPLDESSLGEFAIGSIS